MGEGGGRGWACDKEMNVQDAYVEKDRFPGDSKARKAFGACPVLWVSQRFRL